ncbi:M23 family metallopeptidase [Oceanobacillus profundus]|uniref:M23 family metallopeptidase n=1 Tax=unclassified Oceanobacillus TaxID=2630292 RepID=UPI0025598EBC|nr:M23 family metallopeptidase [Oceanobacillus profundus]MDO6449119.1 M23 family metallopeptidase [Oceanobacillus profundus]
MTNRLIFSIIITFFFLNANAVNAENEESVYDKRMALFKKTEALTQIPWYYFAAIDNYERNIKSSDEPEQVISIGFASELWFGPGNSSQITDETIIDTFDGEGKDGNGDGKADPANEEDVLYTMAMLILEYGPTEDDIKIALWNHYQRDLTVQTIMNTAKVFATFQDINLTDRDFPVSIQHNYSYRNTWGDRRGFGGLRIHEGTDIFANYGVPVQSTTYGVIEMMGWNLYGGWRIGIRDIFNIYHYYAHMSGYDDNIKLGQVVQPGDVLGSVGSTGYGPPGTSGKFPPHLHYGMYKDNGYSEWSFDPYPYLRKWERMARDKQ